MGQLQSYSSASEYCTHRACWLAHIDSVSTRTQLLVPTAVLPTLSSSCCRSLLILNPPLAATASFVPSPYPTAAIRNLGCCCCCRPRALLPCSTTAARCSLCITAAAAVTAATAAGVTLALAGTAAATAATTAAATAAVTAAAVAAHHGHRFESVHITKCGVVQHHDVAAECGLPHQHVH
jgi:hypothetical protein